MTRQEAIEQLMWCKEKGGVSELCDILADLLRSYTAAEVPVPPPRRGGFKPLGKRAMTGAERQRRWREKRRREGKR